MLNQLKENQAMMELWLDLLESGDDLSKIKIEIKNQIFNTKKSISNSDSFYIDFVEWIKEQEDGYEVFNETDIMIARFKNQ